MNNRVQSLFTDPSFFQKSAEEQLQEISKVDPEFFLNADGKPVSPETQYRILFDAEKGSFKPPAPTPNPVNLAVPDNKGFMGKLTDRFAPTAILKALPDMVGDSLTSPVPPQVRQTQMLWDILKGEGKKSVDGFTQGLEDYSQASESGDLIGMLLAGGEGAVRSLPLVNSMMDAGDDLIPRNPHEDLDPTALGSFAGEGLNLALPGMSKAASGPLKSAGWNRMRAALGPVTGAETELLDKVAPQLMKERGLPSLTQRSLEEKLIGKGPQISEARAALAAEKSKLPRGQGTMDIEPMKQATEDVAMTQRPLVDTYTGIDFPPDPKIAAAAREADDLVNYFQESSNTSLVDPLTGTSRGLVNPHNLQTLKETIQERARKGKLYDAVQGKVTPSTEVYGGQAGIADDMLTQISPELGQANDRIHALLTAGESVKHNRLGHIEGFAPPSEVSMAINPSRAAMAMSIGPMLGKLFRGIGTPFNSAGGVGAYRLGEQLSSGMGGGGLLSLLLGRNVNMEEEENAY